MVFCFTTYMHFIVLIDMSNVFNNIRICHVLIWLLSGECQYLPQGNGKGPNIRLCAEFGLQLNQFLFLLINMNSRIRPKGFLVCFRFGLRILWLSLLMLLLLLLLHGGTKAIHAHTQISFKATFALFNKHMYKYQRATQTPLAATVLPLICPKGNGTTLKAACTMLSKTYTHTWKYTNKQAYNNNK